jgi:hypothetical protein
MDAPTRVIARSAKSGHEMSHTALECPVGTNARASLLEPAQTGTPYNTRWPVEAEDHNAKTPRTLHYDEMDGERDNCSGTDPDRG